MKNMIIFITEVVSSFPYTPYPFYYILLSFDFFFSIGGFFYAGLKNSCIFVRQNR